MIRFLDSVISTVGPERFAWEEETVTSTRHAHERRLLSSSRSASSTLCVSRKTKAQKKCDGIFVLFFPLIRIRFTQNTQNTRVYFFARESSEGDQRRFSSVRGRSTSQRKGREKDAREKKGDADTEKKKKRCLALQILRQIKRKISSAGRHFGESKQRRDASTTTTTTTRRWWRTVRERREWKSIGEREWRRTVWKRIGKSRRRRRRVVWEHRERRHSGLALNNNNNNKAVVVVDCSETRPRHPLVVVVVVDCLVRVERERDATRRAFRQCECEYYEHARRRVVFETSSSGGGLFGGGTSGGGGLFGNGAQQNQTNATTAGADAEASSVEEEEEEEDLVCLEIQLERRRRQEEDSLAEEEEALVVDYLAPPLMPVKKSTTTTTTKSKVSGLFGGGQQQQTTSSLFGNRPLPLGGTQPQNQQGLTQVQQQHNAFYNVPESITTQAQGGPTLFGGNLAPSEKRCSESATTKTHSQPTSCKRNNFRTGQRVTRRYELV